MIVEKALKLLSESSCLECSRSTEMSSTYCYYWTCLFKGMLGESIDELLRHDICENFEKRQ